MLTLARNNSSLTPVEPVFAWKYIPGTSQEIALGCKCHHILYTGARGPGKTDVQLMYFRRFVGEGYGRFWRGVIFDREYKMLDDLVSKSKRWFSSFNDGAQWLTAKSDYKWVWPGGEELMFRSIMDPNDYWNYHGQEFPFIGWNELCKYPTSECYDRLTSCNRSSFTEKDWPLDRGGEPIFTPEIPLRVFSTTNPYGPGHNWVKRRFITPAPYGKVVRKTVDVYDPRIKENVTITKTQVAIFGSWRENIYLSPEYIAELTSIQDENIRKAWEFGDWNIVAGGAIDDVWRPEVHVKKRFKIPSGVYVDRAFDWGSTTPFHVAWFAEANGEDFILEDGSIFCPEAGSLVMVNEWYGAKEIGTNQGLKMSATDVADRIVVMEDAMLKEGWLEDRPREGPADNQIRNVLDTGTDTIEKLMADHGVVWEASDKSRGSRKIGLQLFRDRLLAASRREGPAIYFMDNCRAAIDILPSLPRNPDDMDDVDTTAEDHPWDSTRFRILKGNNRFTTVLNFQIPH